MKCGGLGDLSMTNKTKQTTLLQRYRVSPKGNLW